MTSNTDIPTADPSVVPPTASELAPEDPRRHFAATVAIAGQVMDAIRADQYAAPTPCADLPVGPLQEHLVMVLRRVAAAGRGEPTSTWPMDAADVAEGEWPAAWRAAAHDVQSAWGDDALDRPTELPWGVFPGSEVLGVYASEVAVHTWDLAVATGIEPEWDQPSLEFALAAIHTQLPTADRTPMWEATRAQLPPDYPWSDPFGPAVPVAPEASTVHRLVAWNGRDPHWTPGSLRH